MQLRIVALAVYLSSCHSSKARLAPYTPHFTPPITVCSKALEGKVFSISIAAAVSYVNSRLGCAALTWRDDDCVDGGIEIEYSSIEEGCKAAKASGGSGCYIAAAHVGVRKIVVYKKENTANAYLTYIHELVHALGVEHDPPILAGTWRVSVMTENLAAHEAEKRLEAGLPLPELRGEHVRILRQRYCK